MHYNVVNLGVNVYNHH